MEGREGETKQVVRRGNEIRKGNKEPWKVNL